MPLKLYLFIIILLFCLLPGNATDNSFVAGSVDKKIIDTAFFAQNDSLLAAADTVSIADTTNKEQIKKKDVLEDKVMYSAEDSMIISITGQILHLYGNANVKYTDIELTSEYIILDLAKKEVFAKGLTDTSGVVSGSPVFTQGSESFESDSMKYNFDTKKGIIYNIITKQGEGYFHSEMTKRLPNEHIHAVRNKYTTCDAEHPHFYLALNKAIVIPEDKIISGSAYMVLLDVPLPLIIPFGFFPNSTKRSSGVIIPTYENHSKKGMGLRDGGWYQVINDYADLTVLGNYYSRGSWGLNNRLSYSWKYHFGGNFIFNYNIYKLNDDVEVAPETDYSLQWGHRQDQKSNPNQNFSASVDFSSRRNDLRNSYSYSQATQSRSSSSINYSRNWPKSAANFSLSASAVQNKSTNITDVNFPSGSFNVGTKYPFRSESGTGKYKWYENISIAYSSQFRNDVSSYDSLLFKEEIFDKMDNGFKQEIPIGVNFKLGKMITLGPSLRYTSMVYSRRIDKQWEYDKVNDTLVATLDTVPGFYYLQAIAPSAGINFTPKIYGMFVSTKDDSYIKAVRHVISPSASFSYTPDMRKVNPNYFDSLFYDKNDTLKGVLKEVYSPYKGMYGVPYTPSSVGHTGSIRLGLNNNIEMKVMPKNDTTGKPKKVVLLDNLNFSSGYNPFEDSLRWDDVSFSTGTKLFNNKLNIQVNGRLDPYAIDTVGHKINKFYYNETGKLFRLTSVSVSSGYTLRSKQGKKGQGAETDESQQETDANTDNYNDMDLVPGLNSGDYVDYDIPWSVAFQYAWSYSKTGHVKSISNRLNFNGDFSITKNWKIGFNSGYDFELKKMIMSSLSFHRDLHCWEMSFSVVPFGTYRSYSFNIRAKASLLQDLKYDIRHNPWYDKF